MQDALQLAVIESMANGKNYYNAITAAEKITALGGTATPNETANTITGTYKGYAYNVDKDGKVTITGNADGSGGDTDLVTLNAFFEGKTFEDVWNFDTDSYKLAGLTCLYEGDDGRYDYEYNGSVYRVSEIEYEDYRGYSSVTPVTLTPLQIDSQVIQYDAEIITTWKMLMGSGFDTIGMTDFHDRVANDSGILVNSQNLSEVRTYHTIDSTINYIWQEGFPLM